MADLIVPRGIENQVALGKSNLEVSVFFLKRVLRNVKDMMVQFIEKKLFIKSTHHREALARLEVRDRDEPLSDRVVVMSEAPQIKFMNTILQDIDTTAEDFIFYFDRLAALIIEQ